MHDVRTSGEYVPAWISILPVPVGTGIHQMPFRTYVPLSRSLQAAQRRPGGLGSRVVPNSQPAARTLSEWSRIEAVTVGTRTEVQLHAYVESFNGRFRDECLNEHWFTSLAHTQVLIEAWQREYNEERPKKGLGGLTPAQYAKRLVAKRSTVTIGL